MIWKRWTNPWMRMLTAALLVLVVAVSALVYTSPVQAHCDSEKGPVAAAARQALDQKDVRLVLPYVKPEAEAELTAAFKQVTSVRQAGGQAKKLADRYFVETAIRLHRAGEGAPYTGVTTENTPDAILAADRAMQSGSTTSLVEMLSHAVEEGVAEKYARVVEAREEAERLGTVEAHRERAEAELIFEKYIYDLYSAATAEEVHAEGAAHE